MDDLDDLKRGDSWLSLGYFDKAIECYNKIIEIHPELRVICERRIKEIKSLQSRKEGESKKDGI